MKSFIPKIDVLDITLTNTADTKSIKLNKVFSEINIFESLFSPFINGTIYFMDTMDIITNLPIIGNETLTISIKDETATASKLLTFKVYKIEQDVAPQRGHINKKFIVLYFASPEAITNEKNKISKKFNAVAESIVSDVITNNLSSTKTLSSEISSSGTLEVFSNYWKPLKIIDFVSRLTKSSLYSDYIFYEDFDGFNFKSISSLMNQAAIEKLKQSNVLSGVSKLNIIKMFKFNSYFDVLKDVTFGTMGSTYFKPHQTNYSYTKSETTYSDNMAQVVGMGKQLYYDTSVQDKNSLISVNHYDPDISAVRLTSLKTLSNYQLVIKCDGSLERKVGLVLDLEMPDFNNESLINNSFGGKYIITKIKHIIKNNSQYEQNLLLGKNALYNNDKVYLPTTLNNI